MFPLSFDSFSLTKRHNHSVMNLHLGDASLCFWKRGFPNLLPISIPLCLNRLVSKPLLCCRCIFVGVLKTESGKEVCQVWLLSSGRRPSAQTAVRPSAPVTWNRSGRIDGDRFLFTGAAPARVVLKPNSREALSYSSLTLFAFLCTVLSQDFSLFLVAKHSIAFPSKSTQLL